MVRFGWVGAVMVAASLGTLFPRAAQADMQVVRTLTGHGNEVVAVAVSRDGSLVASGAGAWNMVNKTPVPGMGEIKLWNSGAGDLRWDLVTGHTGPVESVAFSPDGSELATGGFDNVIRFWDTRTGQVKKSYPKLLGAVRALAFSPDGQTLAAATEGFATRPGAEAVASGGQVKLWDVPTGALKASLDAGKAGPADAVAFSPDGNWLAGAGFDKSVFVWDAHTGDVRYTLQGHPGRVNAVAFSSDSRWLASAGLDGAPRLWDVRTGALKATMSGHAGPVFALAFSPTDPRMLASAGADRAIRLWDVTTGILQQTLIEKTGRVRALVFSPDGRRLIAGDSGKSVLIWGEPVH